MSSKLLFLISANWMASQSNWFRALYDERKIEGKFIILVFESIRSLYVITPNYTIPQYIIIYYILKSLPCNSMNVSKELLPISNERIMRNGC